MRRRSVLAGLLALPASGALAQEAATLFVQRFYNTYLRQDAPDWAKTVRMRPGLFDTPLSGALRQDAAAQARVKGEIVGLGFDPFLGSQDPGPKFTARGATAIEGGMRVEVYDLVSPGKPMVLVDVIPRGGSWVITNMRYPRLSTDLMTVLKALRQERASQR